MVLLYLSCIKNQEMFNFWYLPLRKAFLHPQTQKITESYASSSDQINNDFSGNGSKENGKFLSLKTETTLL